MQNRIVVALVVLAFCFSNPSAQAQRPARVDPGEIPWRDAAKAMKLPPEELRLLEQNNFVIGGKEFFRQVFQPYLGGSVPVFITSDSVLNAYHVLLEESLKHVEHAQVIRLRKLLPEMWKGLDGVDKDAAGDSAIVKAARRRARIVLGTAIKLLGDQALEPAADPEIAGLIDQEVKKVVEATAMEKPAWLGPPDDGFRAIAYSRFTPRGFYVGDPPLERYFRAVAWLEAIPFRVNNDEELVSALLLGHSLHRGLSDPLRSFLEPYEQFLGAADDLGVDRVPENVFADQGGLRIAVPAELANVRNELHPDGGAQINDQVRSAPGQADVDLETTLRILPARRPPDAAMFQQTTHPRNFPRRFPNGLEVAAMLGSSVAKTSLEKDAPFRDALLDAIAEHRPDPKKVEYGSLYLAYLNALSALFEPAEKDAPALFASQAWQVKNCQTALAGWAQMRHTWILQAKENVTVFGGMRQPSGFVEPTPEFFSRFANLIQRTQKFLLDSGAFDPDLGTAATDLRKLAQFIEKAKVDADGTIPEPPPFDPQFLYGLDTVAQLLRVTDDKDSYYSNTFLRKDAPKLRALADQLDRGEMPADPKLREALVSACGTEIAPLWQSLALLCRRLEALSNKQLRGVAFNAEEDRFIKSYGDALASYMLYFGNSYDDPRDDAPRVADVFSNPREGKMLEVGIGRARVIYVLYPWQGREILCTGAVMPYYEFTHDRPLTDVAWKTLLDSKDHPDLPRWVKPIYAADGKEKPAAPGRVR